jgi:hypothetical protein
MAANGNYFISDGYINSRVVGFGPDRLYQKQWGRKGTGDGEFNLVHDVAHRFGGIAVLAQYSLFLYSGSANRQT